MSKINKGQVAVITGGGTGTRIAPIEAAFAAAAETLSLLERPWTSETVSSN
jgi:hypothetical protein